MSTKLPVVYFGVIPRFSEVRFSAYKNNLLFTRSRQKLFAGATGSQTL